MYNSKVYNNTAYNATGVKSGGSFASIAVSGQGKGIKYTQGSAGAVVAVVAQATGAKHTAGSSQTGIVVTTESGGLAIFNGASEVVATVIAVRGAGGKWGIGSAESVVSIAAQGSGTKATQGGSETGIAVSVQSGGIAIMQGYSDTIATVIATQGAGAKTGVGSAEAIASILAQGKGTKYTAGNSEAIITVITQGTGQKQTQGASETAVVVTTESGGLAIFNGASETAVVVAAESTGAKTGVGASEAVVVVGVEGAGRRLLFKEVVVANDGAISHISLKVTGESQYELMPPTRDKTEQVFADGEVDFGTMLDTGEKRLFCTTADGLTVAEKRALQGEVAGQLNQLREYFLLKWECMPDKALLACLVGRAEFIEYADGFDVVIPLKYQPLWIGTVEHTAVGSGTITNAGTFEAPFVVEITGDGTSPSVTVGGEVMQYDGTLAAGDKLVIDTGKMTAKVNGVNAAVRYNRVFPKLQAGDTAVVAGDNVTIKWRDCWV